VYFKFIAIKKKEKMKFTSPVIRGMKYYVYIYSHPITNEIFYVGKGKGNRVFSHLEDENESEKVQMIKEIKSQGCNTFI